MKTYWNKDYKSPKEKIPYKGYQDPNEIDWSVYGPDRPGKVKWSFKRYVSRFKKLLVEEDSW